MLRLDMAEAEGGSLVEIQSRNNDSKKPPLYGGGAPGKHEFGDKTISGLPESYTRTITELAASAAKYNTGIFVDLGGGTGELGQQIEKSTGIKSLTLDLSPVGMKQSGADGAVSNATTLPIKDGEVGVAHAKDLIEHLNDTELTQLALEAKRVLAPDGKMIITEKYYFSDFPIYQKPYVTIEAGDIKKDERIFPWENYAQFQERIRSQFGQDALTGLPYYPRSKRKVIEEIEKLGFKCEKSIRWKSKRDEPDWFGTGTQRNILVFVPINDELKSEKTPGLLHQVKEIAFERFADPRECITLEDVVGKKVEEKVLRARRLDWAPRKIDIARIVKAVELVRGQTNGETPLRIVDVAGHSGFLDRLILDELDKETGNRSNVEATIVDPDKIVTNRARNYYKNKEDRLRFETEKMQDFLRSDGQADVVICSWMRPEMNLRPEIEKLNPKVIIFVKDIAGDVGQEESFTNSENYEQVAAWLGFSGHDIDYYNRFQDANATNVVLIMARKNDAIQRQIRDDLNKVEVPSISDKYSWERLLPVLKVGKIHDTDDFDYFNPEMSEKISN